MFPSIDRKTFSYISRSSDHFSYNNISFIYRQLGVDTRSSLGFILPRFLGCAVQRNKFKRRCRSAFKVATNNYSKHHIGLVVKPKKITQSYSDIYSAFDFLCKSYREE